jgi:hypothetical protein
MGLRHPNLTAPQEVVKKPLGHTLQAKKASGLITLNTYITDLANKCGLNKKILALGA